MKALVALALSTLILFSCKKDEVIKKLKPEIVGTWEYVKYAGFPFTNDSLLPGNGKIIVLTNDGVFEKRQHDTVLFTGRYHLKEQKDCYGDEKKVFFTNNDPDQSWHSYISVIDGKLLFSTPNCVADGGSVIYRKL